MHPEITTEDQAIIDEAKQVLQVAEAYEIDSLVMYESAADELKSIKLKQKDLEAARKKITKPLDDAKKAVQKMFRKPSQFLIDAENVIKRAMLGYMTEQRKIREEAERKAREAAADEHKRLEEEAACYAEEAKKAVKSGNMEEAARFQLEAEQVKAISEVITAPVINIQQHKVEGISTRVTYKARVIDFRAVLQGVLDEKIPQAVVSINESAINAQAMALKESMKYPGIEIYTEESLRCC